MKKITFLLVVSLAMAPQSISGMYTAMTNADTRGPEVPLDKEQLRIIVAFQENTITDITTALQCVHDITKATQTLDDKIHQLELREQNSNNKTQALENRVGLLEQHLRANQNSTAKKILSHPGTWLALIAVYYLASKYYERRHTEKTEEDEDTNLDELDKSTDSVATDPE